MYGKKKDFIKFVSFIILIIAILGFGYFLDIYSLADLEYARKIVQENGKFSGIVFAGTYALLTVLLVPATPFTIAAGILFGPLIGTFYVVLGAGVGAIIAFFISKNLGEDFVSNLIEKRHKKIYGLSKMIKKNGLNLVLFLRLIPIFPFVVFNYALGLTKIKNSTYILGTFLGIIPTCFVGALFGDAILEGNAQKMVISAILYVGLILVWPVWIRANRKNLKAK